MELFTIKHYTGEARPTIKGNGFDGLEVGQDREEAEVFASYLNSSALNSYNAGFSEASRIHGAEIERLRAALADMLAGWRYIRQSHGDLYGVGWDRAQEKAEKALGLIPGQDIPAEWFGA